MKTNQRKPKEPKQQKYRSRKRTYNGRTFDSIKEADYAATLDRLKLSTEPRFKVVNVEYQVPYVFKLNDKKMFTYKLDFKVYYEDGTISHIDVKGFRTKDYILKKKIIQEAFGIIIIEK